MVEKETGLNIKCLRSDRGGGFTSNYSMIFVKHMGSRDNLRLPTLHNRMEWQSVIMKTLMDMVRYLLIEKRMPNYFWSEAANWGCHILNRCATTSVINMVPEERWSGNKPSVEHVHIFGCIGYVLIQSQLRTNRQQKHKVCLLRD